MGVLTLGSTGRAVSFLQSRLGLAADQQDGRFGTQTDAALRAVQQAHGLTVDGVYGPATNAALTRRTDAAIISCAEHLQVDAAAFGAIVDVETNGAGFFDDGRPVILLERLYVYRLASPAQRLMLNSDVCAPEMGGYMGGLNEWTRFEKVAAVLGLDGATQCVSWGLGQVMGANWRASGAASVSDFRARMVASEDHQLALMAGFIGANPTLLSALRGQVWEQFARGYNGPAQVAQYAPKLAAAYAKRKAAETVLTGSTTANAETKWPPPAE